MTITALVQPRQTNGYGTLAVTNASAPLSGLTPGPNSSVYPTGTLPNNQITIRNSINSANVVYVCLYGGTATAATGIPLAVGESNTWYLGDSKTSPTLISAGTSTVIAEW